MYIYFFKLNTSYGNRKRRREKRVVLNIFDNTNAFDISSFHVHAYIYAKYIYTLKLCTKFNEFYSDRFELEVNYKFI